jgi:hypothetical protein
MGFEAQMACKFDKLLWNKGTKKSGFIHYWPTKAVVNSNGQDYNKRINNRRPLGGEKDLARTKKKNML